MRSRPCPPTGTGHRLVHRWFLSQANFAVRAGVEFEQWARDVTTRATRPPHAGELEDAWRLASGMRPDGKLTISKLHIRPAPLTALDFIRRGAGATETDLLAASSVPPIFGDDWWRAAVTLFQALFLPHEHIFCGETQQTLGVLGETVRTRTEWEAEFHRRGGGGEPLPLLFLPNPVSPTPAKTKDGRDSLRCDASVVTFRHAVAEMDGMPLADQFALWWGRGLEDVSAVTFSGHRSLHVLIRVDVPDLAAWNTEVRGELFSRALVPLGCDPQCMNPGRLSRLAGAWRIPAIEEKWKGKSEDEIPPPAIQKLLFVRKEMTA